MIAHADGNQPFYQLRIFSCEFECRHSAVAESKDGDAVARDAFDYIESICGALRIGKCRLTDAGFSMCPCSDQDHFKFFCEFRDKWRELIDVSIHAAMQHHQRLTLAIDFVIQLCVVNNNIMTSGGIVAVRDFLCVE